MSLPGKKRGSAQKPKSDPPPSYQIRLIRTLEAFATVQAEWDDFLQTAGLENLCLTHRWLMSWLRQFPPQELLIIIILDAKGQWLAAAPLQINRSRQGLFKKAFRQLQFIGTQPDVYDWTEIVTHPNQDEKALIHTIASILRHSKWDVLDFKFLRKRSQCELLAQALSLEGASQTSVTSDTLMPVLALPENIETYEKTRRKKTRLEVNRHNNRFEKERGTRPQLTFLCGDEQGQQTLAAFTSNHIAYWASRGLKSDFKRFPKLRWFYQDLLQPEADQPMGGQPPRLVLSTLQLNELTLSYQLGFWQGSSYLSHITSFNQQYRSFSPGTLHMDALVYEALRQGAQSFNFGRGDEAYKHLWAQEKSPLWNVKYFRHPLAKGLWAVDDKLLQYLRKTSL